jgi:hypothetical protein
VLLRNFRPLSRVSYLVVLYVISLILGIRLSNAPGAPSQNCTNFNALVLYRCSPLGLWSWWIPALWTSHMRQNLVCSGSPRPWHITLMGIGFLNNLSNDAWSHPRSTLPSRAVPPDTDESMLRTGRTVFKEVETRQCAGLGSWYRVLYVVMFPLVA